MEQNKIDVNIHNSIFCNAFKRVILKFIRPELNQVFNVERVKGQNFLQELDLD